MDIQPATDEQIKGMEREPADIDWSRRVPELIARIRQEQAERDALAAQVAALSTHAVHHAHCSSWEWAQDQTSCKCGLFQLMANIPAAAARYLAADRVSQALDYRVRQLGDDHWLPERVIDAMDEWRKAAGKSDAE